MNCTICGKKIVLVPSAKERAKRYGGRPGDYTKLFTEHSECLLQKREQDTIQLIETCTIAEYFVCAIEYGDMSGLDDEEENLICAWLDNYPCCMFEYGDSSEFAKCEITGLLSNCVEVKIYKDQS